MPGIRLRLASTLAALLVSTAAVTSAQFGGRDFFNASVHFAPDMPPDRGFAMCRLMYTQVRREASGGVATTAPYPTSVRYATGMAASSSS